MNLEALAQQVRRGVVTSIYHARSGHPGGSLSCVDILVYLLKLGLGGKNLGVKFILSKGHAAPALYATASCCEYLEDIDLTGLRKLGAPLQGHPHIGQTEWVETSTGSLGQGFSVAVGMAMGCKYKNESSEKIYVMLGDGELQEGEVWEGIMCAAHYQLDNLCAIVDYNKLQSDDTNKNVMGLEPILDKWAAFNWNVIEIDGHDFDQIEDAFDLANQTTDRPSVIIAHTVKGKGVSFMENDPSWHGSVAIRPEELEFALRDLETEESQIPHYVAGTIQCLTK